MKTQNLVVLAWVVVLTFFFSVISARAEALFDFTTHTLTFYDTNKTGYKFVLYTQNSGCSVGYGYEVSGEVYFPNAWRNLDTEDAQRLIKELATEKGLILDGSEKTRDSREYDIELASYHLDGSVYQFVEIDLSVTTSNLPNVFAKAKLQSSTTQNYLRNYTKSHENK